MTTVLIRAAAGNVGREVVWPVAARGLRPVADALSSVLGRPISYVPATVLGYARHLRQRGVPAGATAVQTLLHFLLRFGQGAAVDPTLEELLGRRVARCGSTSRTTPMSGHDEDRSSSWRPPSPGQRSRR